MLRRNLPPSRKRAIKRALLIRRRGEPVVPMAVRRQLAERSGGQCEMALHGCLGYATDPCHRIKLGMGGRKGAARVDSSRLSNLVHGCRRCHEWCHARPDEAYELGLMLLEGQDPQSEPVVLRCRTVYLHDDGTTSEVC